MAVAVNLSKRSQELIKQYIELGCPKDSSLHDFSSSVETTVLLRWLYGEVSTPEHVEKKTKQSMEFVLASLRAELFRDLLESMQDTKIVKAEEPPAPRSAKVKFFLLAAAGTLFAACEGFDSIVTMLSVFAIPSAITLLVGLAFSVLSVLVFCGFDLAQVSKNLGVKLTDAPKLLDLYVLQLTEIKALRKKINSYTLADLSSEELRRLEYTIAMLQKRLSCLHESSKQFELAVHSPKMKIAKGLFVGVAGLLFFGGGFFAGQSVATFMLGLVMTAVSPTFWPVVLFSVLVGAAAFSLYWYVERVGLQQLISGWFGLDEEKIEKLCNQENLDKEESKLKNVQDRIIGTATLTRKLEEYQKEKEHGESVDTVVSLKKSKLSITIPEPENHKISANIYAFHQPVQTSDDEPELVDDCAMTQSSCSSI